MTSQSISVVAVPPALNCPLGIGETGLNIFSGEVGKGFEDIVDVGVINEMLKYALDRDTSAAHDRFSHHDSGIPSDSIEKLSSFGVHR